MRNMSRAYEFIARLKLLNELYPADGLIVDHCTFDLLPTPSTTGLKVYYEYHRYRAITEIPEVLGDEVRDLVMFFLKDIAFKQRTVITGGDGYQFDRRGNVKLEKEVVDAQKNHASVEKAIIDSIKYKVMKL